MKAMALSPNRLFIKENIITRKPMLCTFPPSTNHKNH